MDVYHLNGMMVLCAWESGYHGVMEFMVVMGFCGGGKGLLRNRWYRSNNNISIGLIP